MMESTCQQCSKEFSANCQILQFCRIHNRKCFKCLNCKPEQKSLNAVTCFSCEQSCEAEQSFYDVRCEVYFCKREFKQFDVREHTVVLPCGCPELTQHLVAFMSDFCKTCQRRMKKSSNHQLRQCELCNNQNQKTKTQIPIVKTQKKESKSLKQTLDKLFTNVVQVPFQQPTQKQDSNENEKAIILLLNQDIRKLKEQLDISQFTRMEMRKKILESQRDKQCIICTLPYSTARKPVMICLQQHLSCQICIKENHQLVKCPLCSQTIQKDKIRPSRERLRTLQMESIISQKFVNKIDRFNRQFKTIIDARYKYEIKDHETQTIQTNQPPIQRQSLEAEKQKQKRKNPRAEAIFGRKMKKI